MPRAYSVMAYSALLHCIINHPTLSALKGKIKKYIPFLPQIKISTHALPRPRKWTKGEKTRKADNIE